MSDAELKRFARSAIACLRLPPVIGLLAVLAMRLLQLKLSARINPEQPAAGLISDAWLTTLPRVLTAKKPIRTVRNFFHALASMWAASSAAKAMASPAGKPSGADYRPCYSAFEEPKPFNNVGNAER